MFKLTNSQIADLVVSAQNGNEQAFSDLYTATVDSQLYFAMSFLRDRALAEDAVQEVYMKMFRSIRRLKNPKLFVAYLNRTCYNTCVDYKNKYMPKKYELTDEDISLPDDDIKHLPEDFLELKDTNNKLYNAIGNLPNEEKEIFMLRYYYRAKIREIADRMDLSESTVKRRIKSATSKLKEELNTFLSR